MKNLRNPVQIALLCSLGSLTFAADPPNIRTKQHKNESGTLDTLISSTIEAAPGGSALLTYHVCNGSRQPLVFRWTKPNFESGILYPLSTGMCAVYGRESSKGAVAEAPILYTQQGGPPSEAQAFLPVDSPWARGKRSLTTYLYSVAIGKDGPRRPDQVVDVETIVTETDGYLLHQVKWAARVGAVALKLAQSDEKTLAAIRAELKRQPSIANDSRVLPSREFFEKHIVESQRRRVAQIVGEGYVVKLQGAPGKPGTAQFSYQVGKTKPGSASLVVLDSKEAVVAAMEYSTAAPE